FAVGTLVAARHDPALGVIGVAFFAPADREPIGFAAIKDERDGLRRFAKRNRQTSRRQWVERSGMAGAARGEQVLDHRDGMSRGHADRLVKHEPAVNVALLPLGARALRGRRALAVAVSKRTGRRIHALETIIHASSNLAVFGARTATRDRPERY